MPKKIKQTELATVDQQTIDQAIEAGRALIDEGKTKVEAAMAIYRILIDQPQQTVVEAFVKGADLTQRGALTYWYNCRRKTAKENM